MPLLTSVPPLYSGQPSNIATAYLWIDQLMRASTEKVIDQYISQIGYGDTARFLASILYQAINENAILFFQWDASSMQVWHGPQLPWKYKTMPGNARSALQNHIGQTFNDTGRTGFLLACDLIEDVSISDTMVKTRLNRDIAHMVLVQSSILDTIKGKIIPGCPQYIARRGKSQVHPLGDTAFIEGCSPTVAFPGACFQFEYSPEWQRGLFNDYVTDPNAYLSDSSGWWIKPGGEYIVFLYISGVGGDGITQYFTVDPFLGVFGTSGAMYPVRNGIVIDPNDDFGLGGTNLTVHDWKSRLRARIATIINH